MKTLSGIFFPILLLNGRGRPEGTCRVGFARSRTFDGDAWKLSICIIFDLTFIAAINSSHYSKSRTFVWHKKMFSEWSETQSESASPNTSAHTARFIQIRETHKESQSPPEHTTAKTCRSSSHTETHANVTYLEAVALQKQHVDFCLLISSQFEWGWQSSHKSKTLSFKINITHQFI